MVLPIASAVKPQYLTCCAGCRERVQHRENGRSPDSSAEQYYRPVTGLQNKASARRADIHGVAHVKVIPQVSSGRAIRFHLDADPIALRREGTRKRVAAKKRRLSGSPLNPQNDVLAGQSRWQ